MGDQPSGMFEISLKTLTKIWIFNGTGLIYLTPFANSPACKLQIANCFRKNIIAKTSRSNLPYTFINAYYFATLMNRILVFVFMPQKYKYSRWLTDTYVQRQIKRFGQTERNGTKSLHAASVMNSLVAIVISHQNVVHCAQFQLLLVAFSLQTLSLALARVAILSTHSIM